MKNEQDKHWFYRKGSVAVLWKILLAILALLLILEFFVHHHGYFEAQDIHIDSSFGFYAWYGFLALGVLAVLARVLGIVLKRKGNYYDE